MARKVYTYEPLKRLSPDKTLGIKLPFNKYPGGSRAVGAAYNSPANQGTGLFELSVSTEDQASSNLINLLLTSKGERIFQPDFGTDIQKKLFENMTDEFEIGLETQLREDINRWLPYLQIVTLDVERDIDAHSVLIRLVFRISENGANIEIVIFADQELINVVETSADSVSAAASVGTGGGGY